MIGAAFSSFGVSTELMLGCAVNCCWNSVSAVGGSQVPAALPTSAHLPEVKNGFITAMYPSPNSVALLSVGSPYITSTFGFDTPQEVTQVARPWPSRVPTRTLSKLT